MATQTKSIEERLDGAKQEVARATKRIEMAQKFEKLMSKNDLQNRHLAGGKTDYLGGVYEYLQLEKEYPVAAVLFDCARYSRDLERDAINYQDEKEAEKRTKIVWSYIHSICDRTMNEQTYVGLLQGTISELAFCLKPVLEGIRRGKRTYTSYKGNLREELSPQITFGERIKIFFGGRK